ncbi:MAG: hypothetical protein A3I44_04830 [Candidatus Sungbacteria bacterium RIFCSPLOWO2_02_FULL_51_17]|uniref:DNA-directed DNA polymerase n=1 Tax=Candidatus Sungbacteria bacterium RIFCSPHIGHO2_02_FULL_51_29 TaxID=1802273 RepID=A0A1G2KPB4_9BACT|nr:MAG: hypothetical protein A2676_00150 [Candidatus Sungbacteria bacterium RIFCSPHIGHO2_01_FULL_51_22]OHA01248.1 MAG: hypothetical protein A3C16_02870 [Candidatus Sungbacteria bacterium RIFCSPHIGHO2_02_FULL_51_29]OHA11356.1 MAG: hypothetical protein A3I44_04830 [Candidatus Sungbacteria bacterium RIFCSPLOWO2_02_FULL_51_17]
MIFFLYGPNTYASRKKLRELVEGFRVKSGSSFSIERFDAEERQVAEARAAIGSSSLFQEKKLVVVERVLSAGTWWPEVRRFLKEWGRTADTNFIFWDEDVGERYAEEVRELRVASEKAQEFTSPTPADVMRFIAEHPTARRQKLSPSYQTALIQRFGPDLWGINNELEKAACATHPEAPIGLSRQERPYVFLDALVEGRPDAMAHFFSLREAGVDDFYIWGSLVSAVRALAAFTAAGETKGAAASVEKGLRLHAFVAQKARRQAKRFTKGFLLDLYRDLFDWDTRLKTGGAALEDAVWAIGARIRESGTGRIGAI